MAATLLSQVYTNISTGAVQFNAFIIGILLSILNLKLIISFVFFRKLYLHAYYVYTPMHFLAILYTPSSFYFSISGCK